MVEETLNLLAEMPLFKGVGADDLDRLGVRARLKTLEPGQVLFDQSDNSKDVYFLLTGRLLAVHITVDGREMIFGRIDYRTYQGELAALDGGERSLSIYAHRKAEVLMVNQADFQAIIDQIPLVRQRVMLGLVATVRRLTERLYEATLFSAEQRVRSYLVRMALEAGQMQPGGEIVDAPTHSEIANWIGSNREVVSRIMSGLKKSGIIHTQRKLIRLNQPDALLQAISEDM
ncbi:MAG: Crp/Fnr family transcriptional regulator [Rhizobiaceae bacterium]